MVKAGEYDTAYSILPILNSYNFGADQKLVCMFRTLGKQETSDRQIKKWLSVQGSEFDGRLDH